MHSRAERGREKISGERLDRLRDNGFSVAGVCIFLAAIVWLAFGQTLRHEFVNYDDDSYVYENPFVMAGLTRREFCGRLGLPGSAIGIR